MKAEVSHQFWPQGNAGMEAAHSFGVDPASGMRIEIISVSLAQISVPVSSVFGTLISADETLIKKNHEKAHSTMKAEVSHQFWPQRNAEMKAAHSFGPDRASRRLSRQRNE